MKYFLKRTSAYLIDCTICYSIVMLVIQWGILSHIREPLGITDEWFTNSINMELYVLISISLPVWIYFTYFDSNKTKGTFGKRLLKLSVRDNKNKQISLGRSFKRALLKLSPWEIAHIGVIFPIPLYFTDDPNIRILTIIGILLFIAFMGSILLSSDRKSLYDMWLGTKVIEA